ncbi:KEOPS complex subunit Pcc1 [Caldivirga sp. UBA161]|uniref:KEOPS complex subunit Pcc1 n=1 Tax=Caldivirga sp. UBA161 TaxID=1915569 RepID=UPI0025C2EB13|nr:KEOPS complex subunit Pcc1 [Caldivirga sp. UBA161]
MRSELTVNVKVRTNDCVSILKALKVDEVGLPEGIKTSINCINDEINYTISAEATNPRVALSVWNTIDDFLRNLKAILLVSGNS